MRYLTKEWYDLCQQTFLYFDMRVHNGAEIYDEDIYERLYRRKEKAFIKMEHEVYDIYSHFILGDENRPPFDEKKCGEEFRFLQEMQNKENSNKFPSYLLQKIADMRVFTLGYCTKEVLKELKRLSKENQRKVDYISSEYSKAQQAENIPQIIKKRFGFHDCEVMELLSDQNIVIYFDTRGSVTTFNKITFISAKIIKQDENLVGSTWIYDELYCIENGYEVHILLYSEEGIKECMIHCDDIIIEESYKTTITDY